MNLGNENTNAEMAWELNWKLLKEFCTFFRRLLAVTTKIKQRYSGASTVAFLFLLATMRQASE